MDFAIPKVIGHRGAAGHAPENTLASIRNASELGAKWVEFDIKLSRDGVLVLMHDDTLNRTTAHRRTVTGLGLLEYVEGNSVRTGRSRGRSFRW